jgi:uncharacterized protein YceH (UPF0502 family)
MPCQLNAVETRVLGCLLEKERLTPENYPLSLHSLTAACNQSTNRDPITSYDEKTVEDGVNLLREKKLASVIFGAGSRVQKFRHRLLEHYTLNPGETSILCVLLLRGAQTAGELRLRTERMSPFENISAVEAALEELGKGDFPLVCLLPARPGQKERRYSQLFSAESMRGDDQSGSIESTDEASPVRTITFEDELANLKAEIKQLREEFAAFRKQFE